VFPSGTNPGSQNKTRHDTAETIARPRQQVINLVIAADHSRRNQMVNNLGGIWRGGGGALDQGGLEELISGFDAPIRALPT
jgi:hypothetical protein